MLIARHLLRERSCDDQRGDAIHDRRIEKMDEGMVTPPCRAPKLAFFRPEEPQFGEQFARKAVNRENISHRVPLSSALVFRPRTGETFLRETALIARLRFSDRSEEHTSELQSLMR